MRKGGMGLFIEKYPFTLGLNIGFDLLLGFKLGLDLSQLNVGVNVHWRIEVNLRVSLT